MAEVEKRIAEYFVVAGLPKKDPRRLRDSNLEVNAKNVSLLDPITDIMVIFPQLGEKVPHNFECVRTTPSGHSANLNHGSFRANDVFLCYRRGRHVQPLVDIGVFYQGKEEPLPDIQILEFSPSNQKANVNNTTNSETFLTYRRAREAAPSNELVVMDVCVIAKGEDPPHSFLKIDKTLNKGIMSSDVYICYKKSVNRCDMISYKPGVLAQYPPPSEDNAFKVDDNVALFCLPMGANLEVWPSDRSLPSFVTSKFVLSPTNSEKVYGSAITYYENISDEERLSTEQWEGLHLGQYRNPKSRRIFTNKCICILSHWPFFEAFEAFLLYLHQNLVRENEVPLERYIHQFLFEIPFPSPSRPRILYSLGSENRIPFFQPEELPLPRSGASFVNLLVSLGPDNCLLLLLLALTEQKILLHSFRPDVLTSVAEALKQIIFPFYWQCPYIPLCPIGMSDYLAAPLPFIIGLDSRFFDNHDQPHDVNAIDLDTQTITLTSPDLSEKLLPKGPARTLRSRLVALLRKCQEHEANATMLAATTHGELDSEFTLRRREILLQLDIREAFLSFSVSMLSGYRGFLLPLTKAPTVGATDVANLFDSKAFIQSRDRTHNHFYHLLMKTQMFTKFIEERSFVSDVNAYLAFFDECMDKHDLSSGVGGESPHFLELDDVENVRTVFILPPDGSDLKPGVTYSYDKIEDLNPSLYLGKSTKTDSHSAPDVLGSETDGGGDLSTPLARRTKQEIRSAQKTAKTLHSKPMDWAKCLVKTSYSLWFIHLPSYVTHEKARRTSLRAGFFILRRLRRLQLHPADEICYRVMMQLCGLHQDPSLAVSILMEMKETSTHPNAVTYGYYNKAVLECNWASGQASGGMLRWGKLRNAIRATKLLRDAAKLSQQQQQQQGSTPLPKTRDNSSSRASSEEGGSGRNSNDAQTRENYPANYDVGYSSMNGATNEVNGHNREEEGCEEGRESKERELEGDSRVKKGVSRALFERSDSEDLSAGVRDYYEGSYSPPPHSSSKSRSLSMESSDQPLLGSPEKSSFKSPMVGTPVTSNDPLGALRPQTNHPKMMDVGGSLKASNSVSMLHSKDNNVLGEPFSDESYAKRNSLHLARSSTLPRSLHEEAGKSPFSSLKGFSKSSVTSRLKQGSSYLLSSLSPNNKTTQEVLTNIRSNVSSAASTFKTKYLEGTLNEDSGDRISLGSNESRRASEAEPPELWSSLAGSFWEKWMGPPPMLLASQPSPNNAPRPTIYDHFEKHYDSLPGSHTHPLALSLDMTSASRCIICDAAMYDEEIMAGWTAEDSNLNTKCAFCDKLFVPSLSIVVKDFRGCGPPAFLLTNLKNVPLTSPRRRNLRTKREHIRSESLDRHREESSLPTPDVFDTIRVPYLSPLVLRKELECILEREGDQCLNDPGIVEGHPIIYWNLIWYFHRIGVNSHLPGFCLKAKSLSKSRPHPSWASAQVHNVFVNCHWDSPEMHDAYLPHLYMQHSSPKTGLSLLVRSLTLHELKPRVRIHKIIEGVQNNKLEEPMKLFFEERKGVKLKRRRVSSMYREILFLTCAVNGSFNVNFSAFDRIYRNTLNELRPTYQKYIFKSDEVPEDKAISCRRCFKSLVL